jgi:hypothetical protein
MIVVMMIVIVMVYDKSRDGDDNYSHDYDNNSHDDDDDDDHNSDTGGMNDMIFRSTNIFYNQHHYISHLLELHGEVDRTVTVMVRSIGRSPSW